VALWRTTQQKNGPEAEIIEIEARLNRLKGYLDAKINIKEDYIMYVITIDNHKKNSLMRVPIKNQIEWQEPLFAVLSFYRTKREAVKFRDECIKDWSKILTNHTLEEIKDLFVITERVDLSFIIRTVNKDIKK
jgi:predicted ATP-grasp superfamily ATP-dependent carboligase